MVLRDDIEYLIHCDEEGNNIGPICRNHAHKNEVQQHFCHKVSLAMVYCKTTGNWCVQQKVSKLDGAKVWDLSVGGHCNYEKVEGKFTAQDFNETLIKEAEEELGLDLRIDEKLEGEGPVGKIFLECHFKTQVFNEFFGVGLILVENEKVESLDGEVIDYKWLTTTEVEEFIKSGEAITPTLEEFFPMINLEFKKSVKLN